MVIKKKDICIALVDDDPIILNVFSSILKQVHYRVDFFWSANEALEVIYARHKSYDLIITDICMPGGDDGVTFAKKVREINPDLPIMFMTGGVTPEKKNEALSLGCIAFLDKPFPLIQKLDEYIYNFLKR